jgi:protease-4
MSKLLDLKAAVQEFRGSGKKVIAVSDEFSQGAYFLAAQADEIYLHPMGMILLEGFGAFVPYYKDGIDKLELEVHVFRVGEYKSAAEPFMRNSMSEETKEANLAYMNDLWASFLEETAAGRELNVEDIQNYIDNFGDLMVENKGQAAQMALDAKLVDQVATRDIVRDRLIELVGEDNEKHTFQQIDFANYLKAVDPDPPVDNSKDNIVGVVVAKGEIFDGTRLPGEIGSDSTSALIREARMDDNIKAVVLRVDSPGGSAFASEVIRRECVLTRNAGKPVVISMGSVAASGGYWISTASDEIWASSATITGSIGVLGILPNYHKALSKYLGININGLGTTPLSGMLRPDQPFNPVAGDMIQQFINRIYEDFLDHVAEARKMDKAAVDKIARGRVWSGEDALELGLVDKLGGLEDAVVAAASFAQLGDDYQIKYIAPKLTWREKMMAGFMSKTLHIFGMDDASALSPNGFLSPARALAHKANVYAQFNDPNGVYAYCPLIFE